MMINKNRSFYRNERKLTPSPFMTISILTIEHLDLGMGILIHSALPGGHSASGEFKYTAIIGRVIKLRWLFIVFFGQVCNHDSDYSVTFRGSHRDPMFKFKSFFLT